MNAIFSLMTPGTFLAAFAVTLFAGFVKGAVGFGLPLVMVSGMALFLEPQLALAGLILPVAVSNLQQATRYGLREALDAAREHRRYILIVCVMIALSAQLVRLIPSQTMYLVLGLPVVVLSGIQLLGLRLRIPPRRRLLAEWSLGGLSGVLGGLSGTWGPPTVLYLLALDTPKDRQILVQGLIYGLGAITLLAGHLRSGVLNAETAPFSAALLIPGYLGMLIGFRVGSRLDQELFRKATLVVLILAGLNLLRRGIMG